MISTLAYHRVYERALLFILFTEKLLEIESINRGHKMTFPLEKESFTDLV